MTWWNALLGENDVKILAPPTEPWLSRHKVWIRGPQNSGTNFATAFLALNGVDVDASDRDATALGCWKHTPPWWIPSNLLLAHASFPVLAIVRHPWAWMLSMRKTHYDIRCAWWSAYQSCNMSIATYGRDLTTRPCNVVLPPKEHFSYLEDVWSQYVTTWARRRDSTDAITLVRFEDMLLSPASWWQAMGLPSPKAREIRIPETPSKRHGEPRTASHMRDAMRTGADARAFILNNSSVADRVCERTKEARAYLGYACDRAKLPPSVRRRRT